MSTEHPTVEQPRPDRPGSDRPHDAADSTPLPAAKSPAGTGASPLVAQLLALALVALGVVAVQHLLVQLGTVTGSSWLDTVVRSADGIEGSQPFVLAAAVVAGVVGLLLLPVALWPRPRRSVSLAASSGVHLRRKDLVRVVEAAIDGTDAVVGADVSVTRRRVKVSARSVASSDRDEQVRASLHEQVENICAAVHPSPRVDVSVRPEKS